MEERNRKPSQEDLLRAEHRAGSSKGKVLKSFGCRTRVGKYGHRIAILARLYVQPTKNAQIKRT